MGLSFLAIKYSFTFSKNWLLNKDSRYTFTFVIFMLTKILFADHYVTSSSQIHKSNLEIATYYLGNSFFAIISSDFSCQIWYIKLEKRKRKIKVINIFFPLFVGGET